MIPRGSSEEFELFSRISLFLGNAESLLESEDNAATAAVSGYFLNHALIPSLTATGGGYYLLRNKSIGGLTKIGMLGVTGLLGLSLGLRTCSYSRASSYYMRLQTPLGDYSREQAKILLPGDHPLVKDIDEFSSILEKEPVDDIIDDAERKLATILRDARTKSGNWERDIYLHTRNDNRSNFVKELSTEEREELQKIRKHKLAALYYVNAKKNSKTSVIHYFQLKKELGIKS